MSQEPYQSSSVITGSAQVTREKINSVPTNVITGFLGTGKTSTILHLLKIKPEEERWAVLVNEFGEIGVDGALFEAQHSEQQGVYIREVPGGCMCCTAGIPMQVALAELLRRAKPDRLLVEPTGLGHPKEVLQTLCGDSFHGVVEIQKTMTLVDARHFSDSRYTEHETFQQQIAIADVIIANKQDLYSQHDKSALTQYLQEPPLNGVKLVYTEHGTIDLSLFDGIKTIESGNYVGASLSHLPSDHLHLDMAIPECGFVKAINQGEGFESVGWRFSSRFEFDQNHLFTFLSGIDAERLKATFVTNKGCFAYNVTRDALTEISIARTDESRIEIIAREVDPVWESDLFACVSCEELVTQ